MAAWRIVENRRMYTCSRRRTYDPDQVVSRRGDVRRSECVEGLLRSGVSENAGENRCALIPCRPGCYCGSFGMTVTFPIIRRRPFLLFSVHSAVMGGLQVAGILRKLALDSFRMLRPRQSRCRLRVPEQLEKNHRQPVETRKIPQ
jgi:hypothetical protein